MTNDEWLSLYSNALQGGTSLTPAGGAADLATLWGMQPSATTGAPAQVNPSEEYSYWGGFGRSAVQSLPELIGIHNWPFPQAQIADWRAHNPLGSIGSQVLGSAPAYLAGGWAGRAALEAVPATAQVLSRLGARAATAPITSAGATLALELAPFEAARVAGAAAIGDPGSVADTALSAGLDLALIPVIPAAWQLAKSLRVPAKLDPGKAVRDAIPEFDPTRPAQEQLSKLYQLRQAGAPELQDVLDAAIVNRETQVRVEGTREDRYIGKLWDGAETKEIRRLFKAGGEQEGSNILRRRFIESPTDGFPTRTDWQAALQRAGLPEDWAAYTQFPRHISFRNETQAATIQKTLQRNLQQVHEGWLIEPEADTSLFVMAKKIVGEPSKAGAGDEWLVLKTSEPNRLIGQDALTLASDRVVKFTTKLERKVDEQLFQALDAGVPDSIAKANRTFRASVPKTLFRDKVANNLERLQKMLPEQYLAASKEMQREVGDAWQYVKGYIAPGMAQFRSHPLAEWVRISAQNTYDAAIAKANLISYGDQGLKEGESIWRKIFQTKSDPGGIEGLVMKGLRDEDMPYVTAFRNHGLSLDEVKQVTRGLEGPQRDRIRTFFEKAGELDSRKMAEVVGTERLYGHKEIEPLPGHYGISHTWVGDWRQRIVDVKGRTVAMASGRTAREAADDALRLQQKYGGIVKDRPFRSGFEEDVVLAEQLLRRQRAATASVQRIGASPLTHQERLDVAGFLGGEKPLSRRELADIMIGNVQANYRHIAGLIVKNDLGPDILQVAAQSGREVFNQLVYRINQMAGIKGAFNKAQNAAVSKVLGPLLGNNAADKLVGAYNKAEFHLSLLAFNMSHPALNALTFVQTMLPKIALMRGVPPKRLEEFLGFMPELGPDYKPRGILSFIEPIKVASQGFRALSNPTPEQRALFARGTREAVIAPRFIEEWLGQKSLTASGIRDAANAGSNPIPLFLDRISQWPAAKMEEMSRAHAFMVGEILARKIMGVVDEEQIFQFAKQFTFRTMYQYAAQDRAKLFAGPLGGLFGLFKNWMFHNIADLSQYAGEAFLRNNWTPLLWALGGNAALAGIGGLPLYSVADGFAKMATDKSLMQNVYELFGYAPDNSVVSDAVFYGLPAFFGVSLQGNASGPFSNPIRDINFLFNASVLDRAMKIGKAASYMGDLWASGANPFEFDRTWDLAAYAFAPKIVYKSFSQVEDGALKAIRNGQPIMSGVTLPEQIQNAFGLTPLKIARAYELSEELWKDREQARVFTEQLGETYAQAHRAGDLQLMDFVVNRAMEYGVDLSRIMKSATNRLRNDQREILSYEFRNLRDVGQRQQRLGLQ